MKRLEDGWHQLTLRASAGASYRFWVSTHEGGALAVPDPASRFNPQGVHGFSEVIDPQIYRWRSEAWCGRPFGEAVFYEVHVGSFTPEGSFIAAAERLPDLAALGITAIQLMPLAAFPGERSWGYDGVLHFAPAACYGRPEDLKHFIDRAHELQLMVCLDVVYNHFGPDGNYLHAYCPEFFSIADRTPWGAAINFDGAHSAWVRRFFVENALYWIDEYRFDGLRLDAVHAMHDASTPHIVGEIAASIRAAANGRELHLVLENSSNDAHYLARDARGAPVCATAQWNDDVHHALHVVCGGESGGYYAGLLTAAYACLLLSPQVPMLFMGEEFGASTPFLFFCDFGAELAEAVKAGRQREFRRFGALIDEATIARVPDPNARQTFEASKLKWYERDLPLHRDRLDLIERLLDLRRRHLGRHLAQFRQAGRYEVSNGLLQVIWRLPTGKEWSLLANFSTEPVEIHMPPKALFTLGTEAASGFRARLGCGGVIAGWIEPANSPPE